MVSETIRNQDPGRKTPVSGQENKKPTLWNVGVG